MRASERSAVEPVVTAGSIVLRPVTAADDDLLLAVYASTRAEELSVVPWSDAERAAFLRMQHAAQSQHYHRHFGGARFDVVEHGGLPVGRLYVDRRADEIRIVDIALLTEHRGRGIGSVLLGQLLEEAGARGVAVRIHVEHENPARRWYERLGFRAVEDRGVYRLMEWRAEPTR